jgi:uncharacterized protein YhhL (DUF1145 family)
MCVGMLFGAVIMNLFLPFGLPYFAGVATTFLTSMIIMFFCYGVACFLTEE